MQKLGATPGKLALVAALAVVLIWVVVAQLPEGATAVADNRPTASPRARQRPPSAGLERGQTEQSKSDAADQPKSDGGEEAAARKWPELSLERIVVLDPLAPPQWLISARNITPTADEKSRLEAEVQKQQRKAEVLEHLREQGTKIVVISAEEKRATIGDQTVRVGDLIEGFQITDITKQGVVLTELEQR